MVWGIRQRASLPAVMFVLELQALTSSRPNECLSGNGGADQLDRSAKKADCSLLNLASQWRLLLPFRLERQAAGDAGGVAQPRRR